MRRIMCSRKGKRIGRTGEKKTVNEQVEMRREKDTRLNVDMKQGKPGSWRRMRRGRERATKMRWRSRLTGRKRPE